LEPILKGVTAMKLILASHSTLAKGMKETAEFIMGKQENLEAIAAYLDDSVALPDQLRATVKNVGEEPIIFLSDIKGGSVNRIITEFINGKSNYFLIAGMSLPLVLELIGTNFSNDPVEIKEKIRQIIPVAVSGTELIELTETELSDDF
jgi:fructoselysine and glucoselysine-specific PTS system IIA component